LERPSTVFPYGSCRPADFFLRAGPSATGWYGDCINRLESKLRIETMKFWQEQVEPMSALASGSAIFPISGLPDGVDVHWETQRRVVWNEREHSNEEHELVYEISWIKELGLWRTFLRSHHNRRP
jgi:hypothetical protein